MCSLFRNKYRNESSRMKGYDYSKPGSYFITICTNKRIRYFGDLINKKMKLSDIVEFAYEKWCEIPVHFPFVELDEFTIMPDHVHGIIVILNRDIKMGNDINRDDACIVPVNMSTISPKYGSLGSIIRSYKSAVTHDAHKINPEFKWQPRYYDHIICSQMDLLRIRTYISKNQENWNPHSND